MTGASDEALMLRYGKGDVTAFETLYGRYRGPLYRYFLRHLGEEPLANDLYQGCWEKVIGARTRYREKSPFRAWLFRIAHNHLVDHYRAKKPVDELPEALEDTDTPQPGDTLDRDQVQASLRRAIAALPEPQRDTLLLRLEGDLSLEDIARVTGVNPETAKSRLRYATRKLKQELGHEP